MAISGYVFWHVFDYIVHENGTMCKDASIVFAVTKEEAIKTYTSVRQRFLKDKFDNDYTSHYIASKDVVDKFLQLVRDGKMDYHTADRYIVNNAQKLLAVTDTVKLVEI